MEKNKKKVFRLIIVLLVIFTTLSVWGVVGNIMGVNKPPEPENTFRQFKFNNKLYFYDILNLVGTYDCKTSRCDYALGTIDDKKYDINYHPDASEISTSFISKRYAFIVDEGEDIMLYDVINKSVVNRFKAVKNYGIGINDNYYILQNLEGKWGVMKIDSTAGLVIDYKYDFIGVHDELAEASTYLESDIFIVKDLNGWKLISNTEVDKSAYFINQIYDYNDKYVITKNGSYYYINAISSASLVSSQIYTYAKFVNKYIAVIDNNNEYYLFNPETLTPASQKYKITSVKEVTYEETLDGLVLLIGGEQKEIIK